MPYSLSVAPTGCEQTQKRAYPLIPRRGPFVDTVYAIVELPRGVESAHASLQLGVEVDTRFGLVRGLLPETERAGLSWVLE